MYVIAANKKFCYVFYEEFINQKLHWSFKIPSSVYRVFQKLKVLDESFLPKYRVLKFWILVF